MPEPSTDRMQKLQSMLARDPNDTFLLYAIALEHKKLHQTAEAIAWFNRVIEKDAGYCVAYHQAALTCEDAGDVEAAKRLYREGIAAATKKGDLHAAEEMRAALGMIE